MDIYLMGIGGTGMGALAGLLKRQGHAVRGSDSAVYSPMKEKLHEWDIAYKTPYDAQNLINKPDLIIVGNVIKRDNLEAVAMREHNIPHESFPSALKRLFLDKASSLVASGTHGKTTCSALLAHTLFNASYDPGFLIGGIPINFGESFRASHKNNNYPFVIEGDEYDTAYFDKSPKFMHYRPDLLLITSIEFDHADIYRDLDSVINAFAALLKTMKASQKVIVNQESNIQEALTRSQCAAHVLSYGPKANYQAKEPDFNASGISFNIIKNNQDLGRVNTTLFGQHNLSNALGCYALLDNYNLTHEQIASGFASFLGVKRRLEVKLEKKGFVIIDDFAHHPTAVRETIKAARQKYPGRKIVAIFEPRSATSATNIFAAEYTQALKSADRVILAPVGRKLDANKQLPTSKIAHEISQSGIPANAYDNYDDFKQGFLHLEKESVLLFMSNGDLAGNMGSVENFIA